MSPSLKLDSDPNGKKVDVALYRDMIGSLLYLTTNRPDIMRRMCLCTQYQADPKELHFSTIKHIIRYLLGTQQLGLWYPKFNTYSLLGYLDVDFVDSKTDRKSTTRGCQFISHSLISW